jgi:pyridinium-3,5-biscarboxylic acid mononucleotide sulfurtransferase
MPEDRLEEKIDKLKKILENMESVAVVFSGGVDSTFLLAIAFGMLDKNIFTITAVSPMIPAWEIKEVKKIVRKLKVKHRQVKGNPLDDSSLKHNLPDRCYICKKELFIKFLNFASESGFYHLVYGTNFDELKSHRPGLKALKELGTDDIPRIMVSGIKKR